MNDGARQRARHQRTHADAPSLAVILVLGAVIAFYVGLSVYAAPDFRGSDQYWYVEDTTTLVNGGPAQTHETYPYFASGVEHRFDERRPFIHNVPVLWMWALVARIIGDVPLAILIVNLTCAVGSALLVFDAARRLMSPWGALGAAAALLFVPIGFWVSSQAMAEAASGFLIALALWLVVRWPRSLAGYLGAGLCVALAAAGRIWAAPFMLFFPLGLVWLDVDRAYAARSRWLRATFAWAWSLTAYAALARVFVSYMPSLDPMVILEVSRTNNMVMYYRLQPPPAFEARTFLREMSRNALEAVRTQFSLTARVFPVTRAYPFADRIPIDVAALLSLLGLFFRGTDRLWRFVMAGGVLAFLIHLGMAVVYLNQPRYIVVVLPPLILGAAVGAERIVRAASTRPVTRGAVIGVIVAALAFSVAVDVHNAGYYRRNAVSAARARQECADIIGDAIPANARVVLDTSFSARWPVDIAIYPREELSLATDFPYDATTYRELVEGFGADYLVAGDESLLPTVLDAQPIAWCERFTVYELE